MFSAIKNITMASALVAGLSLFPADIGWTSNTSDGPELADVQISLFAGVRLPNIQSTYFKGRTRMGPSASHMPKIATQRLAIDTSPTPKLQRYEVANNSVNARGGPSTGTEIVSKLSRGDVVTHLGVTDGGWMKVVINTSDQVVWMHDSLLKPKSEAIAMASN